MLPQSLVLSLSLILSLSLVLSLSLALALALSLSSSPALALPPALILALPLLPFSSPTCHQGLVTTGSSVAYDYYRLVRARADTGLGIGAPRGLRTARTGLTYQPPAYGTHQRRRAACPRTVARPPRMVLWVLATRASLGTSRGCRTDLLRPVAPQDREVPPLPPLLPPSPPSPPPPLPPPRPPCAAPRCLGPPSPPSPG